MSKSSLRVIRGGLVLHYNHLSISNCSPSSSSNPNIVFASAIRAYSSLSPSNSRSSLISQSHSKPTFLNALNFHSFSFSPSSLSLTKKPAHSPISISGVRIRFISMNPNLGKEVFWDKPVTALTSTFSRYREAIGLQIEAFCKRNSVILIGAGGLLVCAFLWRIMFGIAKTFVGLSEGMAKYGFLALSSAIVAFAYDLKLVAVDIPMASGPDERLFLIGDEEEYNVGSGLISELRDSVVKAMAATKEFDDLDKIEEEENAERELQEAERKHQEEIEKLEKGGSY
ncbi:hypothetical protein I3842_02G196400 [Carya illinoinensis]|uniref:Uncharacterized protein n=1 Tax=Carya illinoinensis TaxID=32201 RepID=A0A922K187_CARIL|nr:hypothetical protein I3842_02G196400 [Carya illinoinensis]